MRVPFIYTIWTNILRNYFFQFIVFTILAYTGFHRIFSFWFFHGWETSWLVGLTGGDFNLVNLMKSHGFISYFNLLLFGWNPTGWFVTAFLLHIAVTVTMSYFISRMTGKRVIGFISGLLFVVSTAHHDVVTWGTFESLYAAQTLGFLLTLLCFYLYSKTNKRLFYIFSLLIFSLALVLRESGIIGIALLCVMQSYIFRNKLKHMVKKRKIHISVLTSFFFPLIPFFVLGVIYILIRLYYGGSAHDFIDERVQFRILLFHEKRFLEYFWYGIIAFGQYIPPYFVPYPILNYLREFVYGHYPHQLILSYFFVVLGWILYLILILLWFLQRKSKLFWQLTFFLCAFTIVTLFYSFAWSIKPSFLPIPYTWSENRWRYLALTMFAPFIVIAFVNLSLLLKKHMKKRRLVLPSLFVIGVSVIILINLFFLNRITSKMYEENHKPSIAFYQSLPKALPQISEEKRIYYFPASSGINDMFSELSYIYKDFYPHVSSIPKDWLRNDMSIVLKNFSERKHNPENFYFVDFSPDTGIVNKTDEVMELYKGQKTIIFTGNDIVASDSSYIVSTPDLPPVEFPSVVTVNYSAAPSTSKVSGKETISSQKLESLASFIPEYIRILESIKSEDCGTIGSYADEPFSTMRKEFVHDGNIQNRSHWWANCRPAWITFDLGREEQVSGFIWGSYLSRDTFPRHYYYEISSDGETWEKVLTVQANTQHERIDALQKNVSGRYIRFTVVETSMRGMLQLAEFITVTSDAKDIMRYYSSPSDLLDDIYSFWERISSTDYEDVSNNVPFAFIKISWDTEPSNNVPESERVWYVPIEFGSSNSVSFQIPEHERYSTNFQFLKRYLSKLTVDAPFHINIHEMKFSPLFPSDKLE